MNCPNCSSKMRTATYERVSVETCDECGGEFVGPQELSAIVKTRETAFGQSLKQLVKDHEPVFGVPAGGPGRSLQCPACQGQMRLINYAADTGIGVDRCNDCGGMWLDHEELEKVQMVIEQWQDQAPAKLTAIAGKLEEARRQAAQRTSKAFAASRFAFVNAMINRLLDAA